MSKTVYSAFESYISDNGQRATILSDQQVRSEQLLFGAMQLNNCSNNQTSVYNSIKYEKLHEFSSAFQCSKKEKFAKCDLFKMDANNLGKFLFIKKPLLNYEIL